MAASRLRAVNGCLLVILGSSSLPCGRYVDAGRTEASGTRLADRSPALFLEPRALSWADMSRRMRLGGRAEDALTPFVEAECGGGCFALDGGFFAERAGDGEALNDTTPLVCIPGGIGRLNLG